MFLKKLFILCIAAMLTACALGPNFVRPKINIPAHYKETNPNWKSAQPRDSIAKGVWWQLFNDPVLNKLETQVAISNQNIAQAAAQYRQARALVLEAQASFFPTLNGDAQVTRQKQSSSGSNFNFSTSTLTTHRNLQLDASWELDLWGSIRRTVEASKANAAASKAQLNNIQLSSQAALAQYYFQLRTLDTDQQLLNNNVKNNQKILTITQASYKTGVAMLSDVLQAQSQLDSARAAALDNRINRGQYEHAIAVLIGKAPAEFSLASTALPKTVPNIPAQIPSQLLERRPDVAQAERLAAAANAQIGVAIAAFFPTFNLNATGGFSSNFLANWFTSPARFWTLGPELAQTLLDGGLHQAQLSAARANYDAAAANYRQVVLSALQEVEDNLIALRILNDESKIQNQAADSAELSAKLNVEQFKAGTTAYSTVLLAQVTANTASKNANDTLGRQYLAAIGLIKAVGGSWD